MRQAQLSATCEAEATVLVGPRYGKLAGYACACRSNLAKWRQRRLRWRKSRQTPTIIHRFLGGPPLAVVGRLVLLSILVGVILAAIGLDPWNIIESVHALIVHVWTMGFDILRWLWRYFLLGAVIVVPIWLLVRLAKAQHSR